MNEQPPHHPAEGLLVFASGLAALTLQDWLSAGYQLVAFLVMVLGGLSAALSIRDRLWPRPRREPLRPGPKPWEY